ncbi:NYX [Anthophora quadrimaculata]
MKLSLVLGTAFVLSPLIVLGDFLPHENESFMNTCTNNTLKLDFDSRVNIYKDNIISDSTECIIIHGSSVNFHEGCFDRLSNLKHLEVQVNSLYESNIFNNGNFTNIVELKISSSNRGYDTDLTINSVYPSLQYLDLSNNNIRIRDSLTYSFPNLTYFNLSMNSIGSVENLYTLRNLKYLDLSYNKLREFKWKETNNLLSLVLNYNVMTNIGDSYYDTINLAGLYNLVNLSVVGNTISNISPYAFTDTVNLQRLDLSWNSLTTLTSSTFYRMEYLEVLLADNNQFDMIPSMSLNLTTLSLDCNRITNITDRSLVNLPKLRKLSLKGNNITYIMPDAFQNKKFLEELYLNDNHLSYLPVNWYKPMQNLRLLDVSGNKFSRLEFIIQSSNIPVTRLYVERNPLELVEWSTFQMIPKNMTIYLHMGEDHSVSSCKQQNSGSLDYLL